MTKLISFIFLYTFLVMVHTVYIYLEEVVCDENTLKLGCFKLGFI